MKTELIVKATTPVVEANFEAIKANLQVTLQSYNLILTDETVKDGKAAAAELNKMKAEIKTKEKAALDMVLGPVTGFREQVSELITLVDDARDKITEQVKIYEEKTKDEIREQIKEYRTKRMDMAGLYDPFRTIETEDLVLLGSRTKTGNLTGKVMETINGRVSENKAQQTEHERVEAEKKAAEEARIAAEVERRAEENRQGEERKAKERADEEIKRREEEIRAAEREKIAKEMPRQRDPHDTPARRVEAQEEINQEIEDHQNGVPYYPEETIPHDEITGEVTQVHPVSVYFELKIDTQGAPANEVAAFTRKWITSISQELGSEVQRIGVTQADGSVKWN